MQRVEQTLLHGFQIRSQEWKLNGTAVKGCQKTATTFGHGELSTKCKGHRFLQRNQILVFEALLSVFSLEKGSGGFAFGSLEVLDMKGLPLPLVE